MIEIGRLCLKTAGRDAGQKCVIVKVIDNNYVLVDGQTRRKKCNVKHLEPLRQKIELKEDADHNKVVTEFKKLNIEIQERKEKKAKSKKPVKKRKTKAKKVEPVKK